MCQGDVDLDDALFHSEQMTTAFRKDNGEPVPDGWVPAHIFDDDVERMRQAIARYAKPISDIEAFTRVILEAMVVEGASDEELKTLAPARANCWRYSKNRALQILGAQTQEEKQQLVSSIFQKHCTDVDMKVTQKKSVGFYVNAAKSFFTGITDKEGNKKNPVRILTISGLGEAINTAVSAAMAVEREQLATVKKIETSYPDMSEGQNRGCPRISITLFKK